MIADPKKVIRSLSILQFQSDVDAWGRLGFKGPRITEVYEGCYKWTGRANYGAFNFTVSGFFLPPDEKRWIAAFEAIDTRLREHHTVGVEEGMSWFGRLSEQFTLVLRDLSDGTGNVYFRALNYGHRTK